MYRIKDYSYNQAKKLGVDIKPSTNPKKKIDVFKHGNKIASIGAYGYKDYPTYLETDGEVYAENRRRLYRLRHNKEARKIGTRSFYAYHILW